jgi:poly(3-hydroxybutyrate) depolymerase
MNLLLLVLTSSYWLAAVQSPDSGSIGPAPAASEAAIRQLEQWLATDPSDRATLVDQPFAAMPLTEQAANRAAELMRDDVAALLRQQRQQEMTDRVLQLDELQMPFDYTVYGELPEGGRSLFISMHGGGGAPKRVNDRQWENQKRLYQPAEGVYVAPRAPTDTWNLWHQGHIDLLFERLIQDMILFENVNPDRVYLMGYSAGGDGVYQLAPRMADRLAAAAMMAGHPNETTPEGLRNLPFTLHMGANDAAYARNAVAAEWKERLAKLRQDDPDGYEHWVELHKGKGHWMDRQDAAAVPWMAKHTRRRLPQRIVWKQDDVLHSRFYWLAVDDADRAARDVVIAEVGGQSITVQQSDVPRLKIRLNDELLDLEQPIVVTGPNNGRVFEGRVRRTAGVIWKTLQERYDPGMVFTAEIEVEIAGAQ